MAIEKQNDWLVSVINQPDFSMKDFSEIGLSKDNTELMDRDFYKDKDYFKEKFTDPETHSFDEVKFDKFYDQAVEQFNAFEIMKGQAKFMDTAEFSYNNLFARNGAKRSNNQFNLTKVQNPYRNKVGTEGLNVVSESDKSVFEIAQDNNLRDADGNVLDVTANDLGTFKTMFGKETWVLDVYDEDGFHFNEDGRKVKHYKGQEKVDEDGKPYLRALRPGEDVSQKRVMNWTDNLTKDGTYWNKWDVFDNDGKEQNVAKTVVRSALKLAPLLAGVVHPALAPIATSYAGITGGIALAQTFPSVAKALNGIFNGGKDVNNRSDLWKAMNQIEGFGNRFKGSTSEYAQQNTFSFENIASMLTDVPLQLQQQQFIAKIPGWLGADKKILQGAALDNKISEKVSGIFRRSLTDPSINVNAATRATLKELMEVNAKSLADYQNLTRSMSSLYMGITSLGDAWASAISDGHDERTAGLITMGTFAGLYSLMRYTDVGDWSLQQMGLGEAREGLKQSVEKGISEMSKELLEKYAVLGKKESDKAIFNKFKGIAEKFKKGLSSSSTLGQKAFTGALGESIEEVSEEMITDGMNVLANIGLFGQTEGKHEFTASDILSRYAMSALGGAAGGAINVGIDHFKNRSQDIHNSLDRDTRQELEYMTYKYGAEAVKEEIEKQYRKGIIPLDNTVSMQSFNKDSEGNTVAKIAENENETAAFAVKEAMKGLVDSYSGILRGFTEGSFDNDIILATRGNERLSKLIDLGSFSTVKEDFMNKVSEYIDARMELASLPDGANSTSEQNRRLTESANEIDKFLQGEYFANYAEMASFVLDEELSSNFIAKNINDYTQLIKNKNYEQLSDEEKTEVQAEYEEYTRKERNGQVKVAYETFKNMNKRYSGTISQYLNGYKKVRDVTLQQMSKFDDTFQRLQFNAENLVQMESYRKQGLFEEFIDPAVTETMALLDNVDLFLSQYVEGVDSYTAFLMRDKINAVKESMIIRPEHVISHNRGSLITFDGVAPSAIAKILTINPAEDINDIIKKIDELNVTDPDSESYLNPVELKNIATDVLWGSDPDAFEALDMYAYDEVDLTNEDAFELFKEFFKNYLTNYIQGHVNPVITTQITNKIESIESKLDSAHANPVYDLLDKLGKASSNSYSNVLKILKEEDARVKDAQNLTDYILDTPERQVELKQLKNNIAILRALTNAAKTYDIDSDQFGFNKLINDIRQGFGEDNNMLELISNDDAHLMHQELVILETKIDYLLKLSDYNSADKLRSQKKAMVKMQTLQYQKSMNIIQKILSNTSFPEELRNGFQSFVTEISLENAALAMSADVQNFVNLFNIYDDDKLIEFEGFMTKFENGVYDVYQNFLGLGTPFDLDNFFEILIDTSFPGSRLDKEFTTEMAESAKDLTDYDSIINFGTMLGVRSSDFKSILLDKLKEDPNYKYAPIFSQEYPARITAATIAHPEIFNSIMNKIVKIQHAAEPTEKINIALRNFVYIRGFHGAGKSSATLNLIDTYLRKIGKTITASSIVETQVDNLKKLLGEETVYTKNELLDIFDGRDLANNLNDEDELDESFMQNKIKNLKDGLVDKIGDVIYIDEVTHYTAFELQYLSKIAEETNRNFVVLGDKLQEGAFYKGSENNIEYVFKIQTPTLEFSMRSNNIHVKDNNNMVRAAAARVFKGVELEEDENLINSEYESIISGMEFNYHSSSTSFTGTHIVNSVSNDDINKLINISKTGSIGYIYDNVNSATYATMKQLKDSGKNIVMLHKNNVQGLEMDHFVIDVDLTYQNGKYIQHSKLLNTVLSRSREGSILLKNGSTFSSKDVGYTRDTGISSEELTKFKDQRVKVLTEVLNENPISPEFEAIKSATGPSSRPAPGTGPVSGPGVSEKVSIIENALGNALMGEVDPLEGVDTNEEETEIKGRVSQPFSETLYTNINVIGANIEIDSLTGEPFIKSENSVNKLVNTDGKVVEFYRDLGGLLDEKVAYRDVIPKLKTLTRIRQALLKYQTFNAIPEALRNELFADNEFLIKDIKGAYQWGIGKWKVVLTPVDTKRMRNLKGDGKLAGDQFLPQLVYEVRSTKPDGIPLQITVADLHRQTFKKDFNDEANHVLNHPNSIVEIDLPSGVANMLTAAKYANRYDKGRDETELTLAQLENDGRGMLISDPYIPGTEQGDILNELGEPVLYNFKGKPIVFICSEQDVRFPDKSAPLDANGKPTKWGQKLTKDNMDLYFAEYYKERFEQSRKPVADREYYYEPVVQFYKLESQGIRTFPEYILAYNKMRSAVVRKEVTGKEFSTRFDSFTASRMIFSLYSRHGALDSKKKLKKSLTKEEHSEYVTLGRMLTPLNLYFNLKPEYEAETGKLLSISYGDNNWSMFAIDEDAKQTKKLVIDGVDPKQQLVKFMELFGDGYKTLYKMMDLFSEMLIHNRDIVSSHAAFTRSEADNAMKLIDKILKSNRATYDKGTGTFVEIPETRAISKSFYPRATFTADNENNNFVYKMFITPETKHMFKIRNVPKGRLYYLDMTSVKTGTPPTPPASPGGTGPGTPGGGSPSPFRTNFDKMKADYEGTFIKDYLDEKLYDPTNPDTFAQLNELLKGKFIKADDGLAFGIQVDGKKPVDNSISYNTFERWFGESSDGLSTSYLRPVYTFESDKKIYTWNEANRVSKIIDKVSPAETARAEAIAKLKSQLEEVSNIDAYAYDAFMTYIGEDADTFDVEANYDRLLDILKTPILLPENGGVLWLNGNNLVFVDAVYETLQKFEELTDIELGEEEFTTSLDPSTSTYTIVTNDGKYKMELDINTLSVKITDLTTGKEITEKIDLRSTSIRKIQEKMLPLLKDSTKENLLTRLLDPNIKPTMDLMKIVYSNVNPESINEFNKHLSEYLNIIC